MKKDYTLKLVLAMLVVVLVSLVSFVGVYRGKNLLKEYSLGKDFSKRKIATFSIVETDNEKAAQTTEQTGENGENADNQSEENKNIQNAQQVPPETTISEFSTNILTKSKNRADNIKITCEKINGMEVKSGETFSFCGRTGISKESEGYKKADVIVGDDTVKALGGGNCQVSTTLYNAVLNSSDLEVTERHPHGKKVNYVPEGKDAAIAHGSKDFKFKNNSNKTLKIYASSDGKTVNIKLALLS